MMGNPIGYKGVIDGNTDLNNVTSSCLYSCYIERGLPINIPSTFERGMFFCINGHMHVMQIAIDNYTNVYIRILISNLWSSWRKI